MLFFDDYLNNINNKHFECDDRIKNSKFRNYLIKTKGKTLETINLLYNSLASTVKKPQKCLYSDIDYYFALDIVTNTYYLCYKKLMMIDIDIGKFGCPNNKEEYIDFLQNYSKNKDILFEIYNTRNGLHIFILNNEYDYKNEKTIQLMLDLKADFYYIIYSNIRGWCVRLNRKKNELDNIYSFHSRIGNGKPIIRLENLVKLHIEFMKICKNEDYCLMK